MQPKNIWIGKLDPHQSPSYQQGSLSVGDICAYQFRGTAFLIKLALTLKLDQKVISTASVYFHRFYLRNSFHLWDFHDIASTCLFIASKVSDKNIPLKYLIDVCIKACKNDNYIPEEKEYKKWRKIILYTEEFILSSLCYDLEIETAYDFMLEIVPRWEVGMDGKGISQMCWALYNDRFMLN